MGLRFLVLVVFPACPRHSWPDLGPLVFGFGCVPGLPPAFVARPLNLTLGFWRALRARGACGKPVGLRFLVFVVSSACARCLWQTPRGSKILGFRCLLGVCGGGACRQPANKEDPKTSHLRHRVQDTTEHRLIKAQSWPGAPRNPRRLENQPVEAEGWARAPRQPKRTPKSSSR